MNIGQFCPIAKSTEIIGEKWTLLIIRELLMGGTRFNELQRGLGLISPTVLAKRLNFLTSQSLVVRKKISGQKGYEYFPTRQCLELKPVILALGEWGMKWTRSALTDKDYDVELLMLYLKRSIRPENLPGKETVIQFKFTDVSRFSYWWIVVMGNDIDLCVKEPGREVNVYFTTTVKMMVDIWMGSNSYRHARKKGDLKVVGHSSLTSNITSWMLDSNFKGLPSASEI